MSWDDFLAALERDARAEADSLLAAARAEADRIVGEAREKARRKREEFLQHRTAELQRELEAALAAVRREARRRVLEAKWQAIERVFDAARSRFPAVLSDPVFRELLRKDCLDVLECLAGRPAVIMVSPELAGELQAVLGDKTGVQVRPDSSVVAGFRIETCDGSLAVDGTLEKRLEQRRQWLAVEIARLLEE